MTQRPILVILLTLVILATPVVATAEGGEPHPWPGSWIESLLSRLDGVLAPAGSTQAAGGTAPAGEEPDVLPPGTDGTRSTAVSQEPPEDGESTPEMDPNG